MRTEGTKSETQNKSQEAKNALDDQGGQALSTDKKVPSELVPWWKRTGLIAVVTALVAAVAPVTTGMKGFFELRVQQEKNRFDMRDKYLERVIDKSLGAEERERLFEYLVAVFEDDPLQVWAQEQLDDATAELKKKLRATTERLEEKVEESEVLESNVEELERKIARLQSDLAAAKQLQEEPEIRQPAEFVALSPSLEAAFSESQDAVVRVKSGSGILSGFLISDDGQILTAAHGGFSDMEIQQIQVTIAGGETFNAILLAEDLNMDLALLKADFESSAHLELATSIPKIATKVVAIGFFEGRQLSASVGSVVRVKNGVVLYSRDRSVRMSGTAGGPLLGSDGRVIGMHHAAMRGDNGGWMAEAIGVNHIQEFLKSVPRGN